MFCPLCKAEYREGFFRCADCGVDLVAALDQEEPPEEEPSEVVWCGSEPVALSNVQRLLENAKLEFRVKPAREKLDSETQAPPFSQVLVRHSDGRKALALIERTQELLLPASQAEGEPGGPIAAPVPHSEWIALLAWSLTVACYIAVGSAISYGPAAGGFFLGVPLLGALCMIYHAIGHKRPAGKYVLAAFGIPFAFVFYFAGRIGRRKPASPPPNATLERPAG